MPIEINLTTQNLSQVLGALTQQADKYEQAVAYGISQVAFAFEREAKKNFSGTRRRVAGHIEPRYHVGGDKPNVITGNLRRSINTKIVRGFDGSYKATVGPSMVYARAVEKGLPDWKRGRGYPYIEPAYNSVKPQVLSLFLAAVARKLK